MPAPLEFVPESWRKVVITPAGIDRQYYEFCALSELKGALRSGDIWVKGSRHYKNFDDYLIPEKDFDKLTHQMDRISEPAVQAATQGRLTRNTGRSPGVSFIPIFRINTARFTPA